MMNYFFLSILLLYIFQETFSLGNVLETSSGFISYYLWEPQLFRIFFRKVQSFVCCRIFFLQNFDISGFSFYILKLKNLQIGS